MRNTPKWCENGKWTVKGGQLGVRLPEIIKRPSLSICSITTRPVRLLRCRSNKSNFLCMDVMPAMLSTLVV